MGATERSKMPRIDHVTLHSTDPETGADLSVKLRVLSYDISMTFLEPAFFTDATVYRRTMEYELNLTCDNAQPVGSVDLLPELLPGTIQSGKSRS